MVVTTQVCADIFRRDRVHGYHLSGLRVSLGKGAGSRMIDHLHCLDYSQ